MLNHAHFDKYVLTKDVSVLMDWTFIWLWLPWPLFVEPNKNVLHIVCSWAVDGDIVQILSNTSAAQHRRREIKWDSKEELFWWSHKGHDGTIPFIFIWSLLLHLNTWLPMAAVDFRKRDTIISKIDRSYSTTNYIFSHFRARPSHSYKSQGSGVEINICVIFVWLA